MNEQVISRDSGNAQAQNRPNRAALLAAILAGIAAFALLAWKFNWICDDAFISFRYAKNLANGNGLCYNPGSHTPVEGYSNPLWTLLMALFEALRLDVTVWSRIISVLCGGALIVHVTRYTRRAFSLGFGQTAAASLFLATLPTVAVWSTSGLESMPACLLIFMTYERLLGSSTKPHGIHAALLGTCLCLIRADGPGFLALILAAAAFTWFFRGKKGALLRASLVVAAAATAAVAIHVAWRYSYYNDFVPNTAHVKAGLSMIRIERGVYYVMSLFLAVPSLALVLIFSLLPRSSPSRPPAAGALWMTFATAAYAIYVGGDFMTMGRFLLPAMPFAAVLFAGVLCGPRVKRTSFVALFAFTVLALSMLPCFDLNPIPRAAREKFHFRWGDSEYRTEHAIWEAMKRNTETWTFLGKELKRFTKPGESIVLGPIGAQGYYSDLFIYDIYGLTNRDVLKSSGPPKRNNPGHDCSVPITHFLKHQPTYLAAYIVDSGSTKNSSELWKQWQEIPISRNIKIETNALGPDSGFGPGKELLLLRYLPAQGR